MTVSQTTDNTTDQPRDSYADLAATLHAIADDLATLAGTGKASYVGLSIHPAGEDDEATIAAVDIVGQALLGKPGETREMIGGSYHHGAHGNRGGVNVSVFNSVTPPRQRALEDELARLRAEVAAAKAEAEQARAEGGAE